MNQIKRITLTGPRSVGKTTVSKLLAKKLKLKYISSDELGEKMTRKHGGLDKAIKSGTIKEIIKKKGYTLILNEYKKKSFVFDLSIGAFTSREFKKAGRELRSVAKKKSFVIGLLPFKPSKKSVELLYKREIKRKHFRNSDKNELLKRTKKRFSEQKDILLKNSNLIIYTEDKTPKKIVKEILSKVNLK
ncbi:MAG: shikimate kinase [Candidatus Pacearchaeota archaeon]|jgi:shikimate kinase